MAASHEQNVCDSVFDAYINHRKNKGYYLAGMPNYVVHSTMLRMANRPLAAQTDCEEMLDRAACLEVASALVDALACDEGMNAVGIHATSFLDLGKRIAYAERDDWMRWAESRLLEEQFSDVYDGWFSVTALSYEDDYFDCDRDEDDYDD